MPYLTKTLDEARKLVAAGELNPESIMGMEGWPGDAKLEIFVPSEVAPTTPVEPPSVPPAPTPVPPAPVVSQGEGSSEPAAEPTAAPTDPASAPGSEPS